MKTKSTILFVVAVLCCGLYAAAQSFRPSIEGTMKTTFGIGLNGEYIDCAADDIFDFTREDAGTVTITASDNDATAALTVVPGGAAALAMGGASTTTATINSDSGLTFANNSESILDTTDGAFTFKRNDAGTVTLTANDDDTTAAITLDPGGNAALTLGSASDTIAVPVTTGIALSNSESISNGTDGTITLARNTSGTLTVIGGDDAGECDTVYDTTGAGTISVGSADVTAVTITTDNTGDGTDFQVPSGSISTGEILDATITTADLSASAAITAGQIADETLAAADHANNMCLAPFSVFLNPTEASATDDFATLTSSPAISIIADNQSTTEGNVNQWTAPVAGYIHSLRVTVDVAPGAGNDPWTIVLREAGAGTTLTCVIDEASTSCTDTSNVEAIAAGALVNWSISSAGGDADPTGAAVMTISACWGQ